MLFYCVIILNLNIQKYDNFYNMTFKRRTFLQKMILATGFLATQDFALGKSIINYKNHTNKIFHVGSETLIKNKFLIDKIVRKPLLIVSDSTIKFDLSLPDVVLFDSNLLKQYQSKIDLGSIQARFVNSNLGVDRPDFVPEYLVTERTGKKIGILGISRVKNSQTLHETNQLINKKAIFLKEELKCDQVYCLVESLNSDNPIFSINELVENSEHIDHFYTSGTEKKKHQLRVLPNRIGRKIYWSYQSLLDTDQAWIELTDGNVTSYKIVG